MTFWTSTCLEPPPPPCQQKSNFFKPPALLLTFIYNTKFGYNTKFIIILKIIILNFGLRLIVVAVNWLSGGSSRGEWGALNGRAVNSRRYPYFYYYNLVDYSHTTSERPNNSLMWNSVSLNNPELEYGLIIQDIESNVIVQRMSVWLSLCCATVCSFYTLPPDSDCC